MITTVFISQWALLLCALDTTAGAFPQRVMAAGHGILFGGPASTRGVLYGKQNGCSRCMSLLLAVHQKCATCCAYCLLLRQDITVVDQQTVRILYPSHAALQGCHMHNWSPSAAAVCMHVVYCAVLSVLLLCSVTTAT
jgi:hypothetical protein